MKRLAIIGGLEGNEEVIKILESLGGCNLRKYEHLNASYAYYIDWSESISAVCLYDATLTNSFKIFTIDEFNEKYPYRVGEKAGEFEIKKWVWSDSQEEILYLFELPNGMSEWVLAEDIHPIMKEKSNGTNIA